MEDRKPAVAPRAMPRGATGSKSSGPAATRAPARAGPRATVAAVAAAPASVAAAVPPANMPIASPAAKEDKAVEQAVAGVNECLAKDDVRGLLHALKKPCLKLGTPRCCADMYARIYPSRKSHKHFLSPP